MTDALQQLLDRDRIVDVINQLFIGTDSRDWATVGACLADRVHFDMTSLAGGSPSELSGAQIASGWEEGLRPMEAVHHQAGNYRVQLDGDRATAFCYGTASHYRRTPSGRNTRVFVGSYDFGLTRTDGRWRIDAFRFNLKYVDGNLQLEQNA
jgi:hypothetical protein